MRFLSRSHARASGLRHFRRRTSALVTLCLVARGADAAFARTDLHRTRQSRRRAGISCLPSPQGPYAIFFGFTRCPDACPTSLARMARLRRQLGPEGMKFAIVFVSVDPGHDKPTDLGNYVALFGTPIIGLTGTDTQLEQIEKGYGVFSAKVSQPGGDYTIDHTAAIYLMTATGEFSGTIDTQESDASAGEAQAPEPLSISNLPCI